MPDHHDVAASGKIIHVFGHRFVVQTPKHALLADITPKGLEQVTLQVGDHVELLGEMKPTELKVTRMILNGKSVAIEHKKKHDERHHPDADPRIALSAAKAAGFATLGEPRRKPKHFEVLGERGGILTELHIELDGHIRKSKPADRHDPKWAHAFNA